MVEVQQENIVEKIDYLHTQAVAKHKEGKLEAAISFYSQSIDLDENQPDWIYGNVISLLAQLERLDEGLKLAKKAERLNPNSDLIIRAIGIVFSTQGKSQIAIKYYENAIKLNPEQPEWLFIKLVEYLQEQNAPEKTRKYIEQGLKLYPQSYWLNYIDQQCNIVNQKTSDNNDANQFSSASEEPKLNTEDLQKHYLNIVEQENCDDGLIQEILNSPIDNLEFYIKLADIFIKKGDWERSIALYQKALSIEPDNYKVNIGIIDVVIQAKQTEEAIQRCSQFGQSLMQQNRLDRAVDIYQKLIEIKPDNNLAYHMLGDALGRLGKKEEAIAAYHYAIAIKPDFAPTYHNLGDIFFQQERWMIASSAYRNSTRFNPNSPWSYSRLGDSLANLGNIDEASNCYYKAIKLGWND